MLLSNCNRYFIHCLTRISFLHVMYFNISFNNICSANEIGTYLFCLNIFNLIQIKPTVCVFVSCSIVLYYNNAVGYCKTNI